MLKNLKSLFVVEEDSNSEEKKENQEKQGQKEEVSKKVVAEHKPPAKTHSGKTDHAITEKLLAAIDKNNLEGFDYLEFKKSLQALSKITPDEATCFKSAFLTASTMGVTLDKLVETVHYYLKILKTEEEEFLKAIEIQKTENVSKKQEEYGLLNKMIEEKNIQIKKLDDEIKNHQRKADEIKSSITKANVVIEETKKNFLSSYHSLKSQIEQDAQKMQQYLKS